MKKNLLIVVIILFGLPKVMAQGTWVPAVNFGTNSVNICDYGPWKMVFYDDFNGTSLDSTKWITFTSQYHRAADVLSPGGTLVKHDRADNPGDWKSGAWNVNGGPEWNVVLKPQNVIVSNGTVKLKVKWEPSTLNGFGTRYYSAGQISTRYWNMGQKKAFNSGKFEVKMKMPDFFKAHTTIWTWAGEYMGVNEIDMAESYGKINTLFNFWHPYKFRDSHPSMYYPTHAWGRTDTDTFPPILPWHDDDANGDDASQSPLSSIIYPNMSYVSWLTGNFLNIADMHIYTCEWDTSVIRFYLDHQEVATMWKYYKLVQVKPANSSPFMVKVGSGCNPSGTYEVTYGFPYRRDRSESNFRITTGVNKDIALPTNSSTELGQAEIDYVKISQRNPALDGYTEICSGSPQITGSASVCGNGTFTVSPSLAGGGYWTTSNNSLSVTGTSNGGNTVTVQNNPSIPAPSNVTTLTFIGTPSGCPPYQISKTINNGTVGNQVVACFANRRIFTMNLSLSVINPIANATYEWAVEYIHPISGSFYLHQFGTAVQTPNFAHWGIPYYKVNWQLKVTNSCGTRIFSGSKNAFNLIASTVNYSDPKTYMAEDGSAVYLKTVLNETDSANVERNVGNILANKFILAEDDVVGISSLVHKTYMDCLEPYIVFDDLDTTGTINGTASIKLNKEVKTMVFPNPTKTRLAVAVAGDFNGSDPIYYKIYSVNGKVVQENKLGAAFYIDVEDLSSGMYILELTQNETREKIKFTKL